MKQAGHGHLLGYRYLWVIAIATVALTACGGSSSPETTTAVATSSSGGTSSSSSSSSGASTSSSSATGVDVLTYHNDVMRTGENLAETTLTPTNVTSSTFGKLSLLAADSTVDAMPLVATGVTIGGAVHNVIYVASENDTVYAYDMNTYAALAQVSLLATGETAASTTGGCTQVQPKLGVTATPVIDRSAGPNGTMFIVAMSQDSSGNTVHRLHALDLATLADRTPAVVISSPSGSSTTAFNPRQYKERGALLLLNGQIYTSWASNCDITPYQAWIMAYNESLTQTQVINLTPNGSQGAVWSSGGVVADSGGSLYVLLGNGTYDANQDYGNALVRLTTTGSALTVADYFTPYNTVSESAADVDFGSGSPMVIPDTLTDSGGTARSLIFAEGKDDDGYLLDRTNLGKFNSSTNQVYQEVQALLGGSNFSAPAYYNGTIYLAGAGAALSAHVLSGAMMPTTASSHSAVTFAFPGASPAVSANGTTNGIVWAVESATSSAAVLHAYNPANLATEYYNSTQASGGRDSFGNGDKFVTPVIADGRVLVATPSGVAVFGLL